MDFGKGKETSKSNKQVMDKGGLNKGDRISGKGSDWRHIFVPQLLLDWIRGVRESDEPSVSSPSSRENEQSIKWAGKAKVGVGLEARKES